MTEYDARKDSSAGTDDLRADAPGADLDETGRPIGVDGVILVTDDGKGNRTCSCGCGRRIAGKVHFVQGHDQRLIGILTRAARNGQEVTERSGGVMTHGSAETYARRVLTGAGVAKLIAAVKRPVAAPRTREVAPVEQRTEHGQVKIGRWTYLATRVGDRVVWTDKKDQHHEADAKAAATFKAV